MKLEYYLQNSKKGFIIFAGLLLSFVGGLSFYFGSTIQSQSLGPSPVKTELLGAEFERLASLSRVAGAFTSEPQDSLSDSLPVLVYHGILENSDGINIGRQQFYEQMKGLSRAGWQSIGMNEFASFVRGNRVLPAKSFLLTFDDGRKDSFYGADPVLKLFGFQATMFIITGSSFNDKTTYYLNRNELKYMKDSGRWSLQAHAREGHDPRLIDENGGSGSFLSNRIWLKQDGRAETEEEYRERASSELAGIKEDLESNLEITPTAYAFPYGDYGIDSKNIPGAENYLLSEVAKNYSTAFAQVRQDDFFSQNYPANGEFYLAKRITVSPDWAPDQLAQVLEAGSGKRLPFQEDFTNPANWVATWGLKSIENNSLRLSAAASSTGASIYLDGGGILTDYTFKAKIKLVQGQSVSVLANYLDEKNYLSCAYSSGGVVLNEIVGGEKRQISSWWFKFSDINVEEAELGITVGNGRARCLMNGQVVITSPRLSDRDRRGSAGFKIWDLAPNNAVLYVYSAALSPATE